MTNGDKEKANLLYISFSSLYTNKAVQLIHKMGMVITISKVPKCFKIYKVQENKHKRNKAPLQHGL